MAAVDFNKWNRSKSKVEKCFPPTEMVKENEVPIAAAAAEARALQAHLTELVYLSEHFDQPEPENEPVYIEQLSHKRKRHTKPLSECTAKYQ